MISKASRIARMIVLASFALSSAAWAATCSNASLSGTYGFLHGGTDVDGAPTTSLSHITFDPTTGTFTSVTTASHDGVITTESLPGNTQSPRTAPARVVSTEALPRYLLLWLRQPGGWSLCQFTGATRRDSRVKQGSPTCTNAGVEGSFGFEATGVFLAGAPVTGPVAFIGELKLTVNASGEGVISGQVAGSEDGTILAFAEEPVTGSYSVTTDCTGTATITPMGRSPLNFSFVVVDGGKEMLAIEMDADTVVSGTLVKGNL